MSVEVAAKTVTEAEVPVAEGSSSAEEKADEVPQDATMDENEEEKMKRAARQSA